MPARATKRKTRYADYQSTKESPNSSLLPLETDVNRLTEKQIDDMSLKVQNQLSRKKKDQIRKFETTS